VHVHIVVDNGLKVFVSSNPSYGKANGASMYNGEVMFDQECHEDNGDRKRNVSGESQYFAYIIITRLRQNAAARKFRSQLKVKSHQKGSMHLYDE